MKKYSESRVLFDCGFSYGFSDGVQYDLGCIRRVFGQGDVVKRLRLVDLVRNVLDGGLDEREHCGYGFIQVRKADGIDPGFIYGHLYLQVGVIQGEGGCVHTRIVLLRFSCPVLCAAGAEHDEKKDDEQDSKRCKNGCVDDLFHMQDDDFCSESCAEELSRLSYAARRRRRVLVLRSRILFYISV